MNFNRRTLGCAAAAVLIGALLFVWLRPREPEYQGRRLSEWLKGFSYLQPNDTEDTEARATEAAVAVRAMGTNCLSTLMAMLQAKDSSLKRHVTRWLDKQSVIRFHFSNAADLRNQAELAVGALGPLAKPAIPRLVTLLKDDELAGSAVFTLTKIGPDALPALAAALTNDSRNVRRWVVGALGHTKFSSQEILPLVRQACVFPDSEERSYVARALGDYHQHRDAALPGLLQLVEDEEPSVRASAVQGVARLRGPAAESAPVFARAIRDADHRVARAGVAGARQLAPAQADVLVPPLIVKLNEPDGAPLRLAVLALARFGDKAKPAVPALVRLASNASLPLRETAVAALYAVDPQAAAAAGFKPTGQSANPLE
ncbi:MAG: HEAT repeat domain-containing protein [Verrucomicrobia bacterium]|nr:HEAT repeat domain-containing protein [Verrucomicrobiota bacterium]